MKKKRKQKPINKKLLLKEYGDRVIPDEAHEKFKKIVTAPIKK